LQEQHGQHRGGARTKNADPSCRHGCPQGAEKAI
jgi:hypothetical protein